MFWIFALNFIVGVINFLPLVAFDGASIFTDLFWFYSKRKKLAKIMLKIISLFILGLLIMNALPYFVSRF
jgi:membrane-associated protease RseP (regulator of RpoE activity)